MPATRRRACSVRAIEAGSLSSDELDQEINIERVFEAGSLSVRAFQADSLFLPFKQFSFYSASNIQR